MDMGLNVGGNYINNTYNDNQNNQKMFVRQENYSSGLFETPNFQQMVPQVGYVTRPGQPVMILFYISVMLFIFWIDFFTFIL